MTIAARAHRVFISNNARLWTNIVFVVATVKIWMTPLKDISEFVWMSWMGIAGGVELLKRVIGAKYGMVSEERHDDDHPKPRGDDEQ